MVMAISVAVGTHGVVSWWTTPRDAGGRGPRDSGGEGVFVGLGDDGVGFGCPFVVPVGEVRGSGGGGGSET